MRIVDSGIGAALAVAAFVAGGLVVRAAQPQIVIGPVPAPAAPGADASEQALSDEFEQRLLASTGSQSLTAVRGRFNYLLARKLAAIDRAYRLSDDQKQKLALAAQGDLQRFEDWLARERRQFIAARGKAVPGRNDPAVLSALDPLRNLMKWGPFGDQSLLAKMRSRVLSAEQVKNYERRRQLAAHSGLKITDANVRSLLSAGRFPRDVNRIVWSARPDEVGLLGPEGPLEICSADGFQRLRTFGEGRKLVSFDLGPKADVAAVGENSTRAFLVRLSSGKRIELETKNQRPVVSVSPDGRLLATGGWGSHVVLWSAANGKEIRQVHVDEGFLTPVFSPDGKILAVGNRSTLVRLFDVETGRLLRPLSLQSPCDLKFDPAGKRLAAVYAEGFLGVWDVEAGELLRIIKTSAEQLECVDWSPDSKLVVSAGVNTPVTLWNAATLAPLIEIDAPERVSCARFNPDGTRLVIAGGPALPGGERVLEVWGVPPE
jgi:WD40 repeat protein